MGAGDRQQDRVTDRRFDVAQCGPNDGAKAARFRLLDEREEHARSVVHVGDHEAVHALAARVEQIVCPIGVERDVRDERDSRQPLLEVPDALEVGSPAGEEIDHRQAHGLPLANPENAAPVVAGNDLVTVPNGGSKPLKVRGVRKQGRDDAHGGDRVCDEVRLQPV